jgi:FKBP-type peptidyl-prolyl cis-trans isomerase SlyD
MEFFVINDHESRIRSFSVCAMLMSQSPNGRPVLFRVHEVRNKTIVVDFNHPLAGKTLNFDVKVTDIRAAETK